MASVATAQASRRLTSAVLRSSTTRILGRALFSSSSAAADGNLVGWEVQPLATPSAGGESSTRAAGRPCHVGILTLQSEANLNALTVELGREFQSTVQRISHDIVTGAQHPPNVDVVILKGAGDSAFSAGGNLEWLQSLRHNSVHQNADLMLQFYNYFLCVRQIPVPVICALHGPAMGAGAGLALACDLRTAAPRDKILGLHFTRLGIHTGMGASHFLPQAVNAGSAVLGEILLRGKILSGREAFDLGLVNRLAEDAKQAAHRLAEEITVHQHPVAVRTLLQTLRQQQDVGLGLALQREAMAQAACYAREDWGEGVDAVAAKRDPVFAPYHSD